jgi:spermidine synthase
MEPSIDGSAGPVPAPDARLMRALLPGSVFLSGGVVMVLEVLGTRLIAPVYGTSLHVWSALIAVTLLSLSVGYWLGGRIADRWPRPAVYFLLFEASALLIALAPLLRIPVLETTQALGLRAGALAAATILFAPPLTLLGMLSPFAVRLAADLLTTLGSTTGRLYAVSTAGSLLGTLLTGFYLIPSFRVRSIFLGAAGVLLVPALVYQAVAARRQLVAAAAVVVALVFSAQRPWATAPGVLLVRDSPFGQIKVLDRGGLRSMLINGAIQTEVIPGTTTTVTSYVGTVVDLAWRANPRGKNALIVGLGGGVIPPLLDSLGIRSTSVEIDGAILDTARTYFGFDAQRFPVAIEDGRRFLATSKESYDFVILDAFAGEVTPVHLLTREMMDAIDRHLAPGGVVVLNYVGYRTGPEARALRSVARTMAERFPAIAAFAIFPLGEFGNTILVASRDHLELSPRPAPIPLPLGVRARMREIESVELVGPSIVLTDDYNPLELWAADAHEMWRKAALRSFPSEVVFAE